MLPQKLKWRWGIMDHALPLGILIFATMFAAMVFAYKLLVREVKSAN